MQLTFKVDTARVTLGDLISLESAKMSSTAEVMARCLTDGAGNFVPTDEARKIIFSIPIADLTEAIEKFGAAMEAFKNNAVPRLAAASDHGGTRDG